MIRQTAIILVLICYSISFNSCSKTECESNNPIFHKHLPNSPQYKSELARLLKNANSSQVSFWFKEYIQNDKKEYILLQVQGTDICGIMELEVANLDKLQQLRSVKGKGFRGAEFKNLQYEVKQDSVEIRFLLKAVENIFD
jgi:hypothetical protein